MDVLQFQRRIGSAATVAMLAALVFVIALAYRQVFQAELAQRDGNPRLLADFANPGRGRILDRAGNVLAESDAGGERIYLDEWKKKHSTTANR